MKCSYVHISCKYMGPNASILWNQVHHKANHHIEECWGETHLKLWNCLHCEFLKRRQLITFNHLLWDPVEEVAKPCNCNLYPHWVYSPNGNREKSSQYDMTIMWVVVGECKVFHWHNTPYARAESRWDFQFLQPHTHLMFLFIVEVVACCREVLLPIF